MGESLSALQQRLTELKSDMRIKSEYFIPAIWQNPYSTTTDRIISVNPLEYYLEKINEIHSIANNLKQELSDTPDSAYNLFVRYAAAFDHDGDSALSLPLGKSGWRETGTFLKALSLLPYIYSLGCNIIYLLPITSVGKDGRKGNLGSPYAIRNPFKLDEMLSEPILQMSVEEEFSAFVEAAHLIGIKVIVEFVFRTASLDSSLALEHPEWFYWIKSSIQNRRPGSQSESKYGPPVFQAIELEVIKQKIEAKDFSALPKPHKTYRDFFTSPPRKIARIDDKVRGVTESGIEVKIPSAFADWPPDDVQPVWSDVTYLKLYDSPKFNYIAYNTVRMYDTELMKPKYRVQSLWESITGILPHYIEKFNIDGVMVDMGHALPTELRSEIVKKAKNAKPSFKFWEETFNLSQKSVDEGYEAVAGYLPFDQHVWWKVMDLLRKLENGLIPIKFFATPETHNTPRAAGRAGGIAFSKISWLMNSFIPAIPFIHAGFELGEKMPVNTGLGFESEELAKYSPEILPLFSAAAIDWMTNADSLEIFREVAAIRNKYLTHVDDITESVVEVPSGCPDFVVAFSRKTRFIDKEILIAFNLHEYEEKQGYLRFSYKIESAVHLLGSENFYVNEGFVQINLKPFEYICLECRK